MFLGGSAEDEEEESGEEGDASGPICVSCGGFLSLARRILTGAPRSFSDRAESFSQNSAHTEEEEESGKEGEVSGPSSPFQTLHVGP